MTDKSRKGFIVYLFAGLLVMLAVTIYARLTEPSLVKHAHEQAAPAQESTMPQSEIGRLMLSLQDNPNNPAALLGLASELIKSGDLQSARTFLERAETADVNNPDPSYLLGYISHLEKKEDEAVRYMEKALTIKEQPAVHYSIGTIYRYFLKEDGKAREHWNRALAMKECSDVQRKLIEAELKKLDAAQPDKR